MPAREVLTLNTSIPRIEVPQAGDTYVMPRDLAVSGFITEAIGGVVYPVASQFDIGTNPNQIPLNQYLGTMAYQDAAGVNVTGVMALLAGAAATPSLSFSGDSNTGVFSPAADTLALTTGGSERVRLDAAGNLGLAVTPSAWNTSYKALQASSASLAGAPNSSETYLTSNAFLDSGAAWKYVATAEASRYDQAQGVHRWTSAVSGTAGTTISFTEGMRLNASGNLGLGTTTFGTSAAKVLSIGSGTEPSTGPADTVQFYSVDRSAGNTIPAIYCEGSGVTNAGITNVTVTHKIALKVNGTVYYLLATTDAT
jgi:hypothetical protein